MHKHTVEVSKLLSCVVSGVCSGAIVLGAEEVRQRQQNWT